MHIFRNTRIQVCLATLLLASAWGAYVTPVAQAEENTTIRAEWQDLTTGSTYYNWSSIQNDQYTSKVIVSTKDGKWARLDDKFGYISSDMRNMKYPYLFTIRGTDPEGDLFGYSSPLYLNMDQNEAVRGNKYDVSPDGKWGLYSANDTSAEQTSDGKYVSSTVLHSYFIKNMSTGVLQEWISSSRYVSLYWLADSTLLVNDYSPVAKQKAISTYNPATDKKNELVLGSLNSYSEKDQTFVFAKNEPKRLPWLFDLKTGKSRLLTEKEREKLYTWRDTSPTTEAPENLDVATLPIINVPIHHLYEHEVFTSQGSELVPYAFEKEGKTFIRLRSILSKFSLSIGQREGDMYNYQYKLTGPTGQSMTLDRNNSRVFQFRLFVTPEVLEKVGLQDVTVKPLIPGVIK